jgi:hypothetical protein
VQSAEHELLEGARKNLRQHITEQKQWQDKVDDNVKVFGIQTKEFHKLWQEVKNKSWHQKTQDYLKQSYEAARPYQDNAQNEKRNREAKEIPALKILAKHIFEFINTLRVPVERALEAVIVAPPQIHSTIPIMVAR